MTSSQKTSLSHLAPYFSYDDHARLCVHHGDNFQHKTRLESLHQELISQGATTPCVLYFDHILKHRMEWIYSSFSKACEKYGYEGRYALSYPIKVNPAFEILSTLKQHADHKGYAFHFEVGSKSEMLAVLAVAEPHNRIVVNGFKDRAFYGLAQLATDKGFDVIMVIEHIDELSCIEAMMEEGVTPAFDIGLRLKPVLNDIHSLKFGLSFVDVCEAARFLFSHRLERRLKLLHGHIGSQLDHYAKVAAHARYMVRFYAELKPLCQNLTILDFGGGLGVDYHGDAHRRYDPDFYAGQIVSSCMEACLFYGVDHPDIFTESGRAVTAHSSLLMVDPQHIEKKTGSLFTQDGRGYANKAIIDQWLDGQVNMREAMTALQDNDKQKDEETKAWWLNFSLFQSLPDHWGIAQHFPILPLEHYEPNIEEGVRLFDISCDADGIFGEKNGGGVMLPCAYPGTLAVMLTGAYQSMLSAKHNMIGNTARAMIHFEEGLMNLDVTEAESNYLLLMQYGYNPLEILSRLKLKCDDEAQLKDDDAFIDAMIMQSPYLQPMASKVDAKASLNSLLG
ncbi:MAG: arginine decarboxylase [Francisellaceae bacterium]